MQYSTELKTCPRCRGKGWISSPVVYAGAPGGCFKCNGAGEVYKDAFYQQFGVGRTFYGITMRTSYRGDNPNNGVFKLLSTTWNPATIAADGYHTYTAVEITEEQARRFWKRYGQQAITGGVRVNSDPAS